MEEFQFNLWWRDLFVIFTAASLVIGIVAAVLCRRSQKRLDGLNTTRAEAGGGTTAFRSQVTRVAELVVLLLVSLNLIWKHRSMSSTTLSIAPLGVLILLNSVMVLRDRLYWERWINKATTPAAKKDEAI